MGGMVKDYSITTEFTTSSAGMCKWAFAKKQEEDYFIKQLLSPKFPTKEIEKALGKELSDSMRKDADMFERTKKCFYDRLSKCRTGNVVVVEEFFREDSFFYLTTKRVQGPFLNLEQISKLDQDKKRTLLKAVAYSMISVHEQGIVHADLKPENVLIRETVNGFCTAKLIDFDSGYLDGEPPKEIVGDQRYFSPEAIQYGLGETDTVGVKNDVFALGILFHQYWCGNFPSFKKEYESASIALLEKDKVTISNDIPADVCSLLVRMLALDPDKRPSCREVWETLSGNCYKLEPEKKKEHVSNLIINIGGDGPSASASGGFYTPGNDDLCTNK